MRLLLIASVLAVSALAALTDLSFDQYISTYSKRYTGAEYRLRRKIFETRVRDIKAHNARPGVTYTRTVNQFTDHTEAELSQMMGLNKHLHFQGASLRASRSPVTPRLRSTVSVPDEIDWSKNATTPVKNQGGCGSCWAFAGTESIESCAFLGSGKLVTLAPQEFVDCVPNPQKCGGSGGCEGATTDLLFDYVKNVGAVTEKEYPYEQSDRKCRVSEKKTAVNVGGYVDVANNDYHALLEAVSGRPVTVGVAANEWFSYDKGVFTFDECGTDMNHAVLLVGYGVDEKHGDYWKVQNSWGPGWGEEGFIRLARSSNDSNNCQVDTTPLDGFGCPGGPANVTICGTCGILFGASYPINCVVV